MHKLLFLLFLFISNLIFAQPSIVLWEKTIGDSKNDEAHRVILTTDNHYLIIGYTQPEERYDLDLFISKINSEGEIIWKKNFGTSQVEIGYDITEDADGNYIAVGKANTSNHSSQIWVIKIEPNGNLLWEKKYGLINNDAGKSIFTTKHSQIVIGGEQEGNESGINHALWLVLDKDGNKINEQTYGGDHFQKEQKPEDIAMFGHQSVKGESCNQLIKSKSGGFLFVGNTITKAKGDLGTDGWLVKLDDDGKMIWDQSFGAFGGDNILDIAENNQGEIFTIGEYYDKPRGRIEIWLTKHDASGKIIFDKQFGAKNFNGGEAGLLLENNEIIICGFTSSKEPMNIQSKSPDTLSLQQIENLKKEGWQEFKFKNKDENEWKPIYQKEFPLTIEQQKIKTDRDIWLGKIDVNANLVWEKTFGGLEDDEAFSIIKDHEGNYILVGYTRSKGNGLKDILILKLKELRA